MTISIEDHFTRLPDVIDAKLDDGLALLNIESGEYYNFNSSARNIWELLAEPLTPLEVRDRLLEQFAAAPDQCLEDVITFIEYLFNEGIVTIADRGNNEK